MDFFLKEGILPMDWSPVAQGKVFQPSDEKGQRVALALSEVAAELVLKGIASLIYAWILYHPAWVIPIAGSGRLERVREAVDGLSVNMTREQWYRIYVAAKGEPLP